jgi:hypothetical protein
MFRSDNYIEVTTVAGSTLVPTLLESHAIAGVPASGGDPSPACVPDVVGHKIVNSLLVKVIRY